MKTTGTIMAVLTLAVPAPWAEGRTSSWRETLTPHFVIRRQASWLPRGFSMGVERVHSRLRWDLGMFSPGISRDRINLFLYADHESYLGGEFRPPRWSNGLAVHEHKAVALPSMKDPRKLLQVMAHETTHLLFDGYWRERHREPPAWLNEGLAMLQEADAPGKPETSVWYQQMTLVDPTSFPALETFFRVTPTKDLHNDEAAVSTWYLQAYSVTHFLLRGHSRMQFKSLCGYLRDGRPAAKALWLSYRYRTVAAFDRKWREWLADPVHKRRVGALAGAQLKGVDEGVVSRAERSKSLKKFSFPRVHPFSRFGNLSTPRE